MSTMFYKNKQTFSRISQLVMAVVFALASTLIVYQSAYSTTEQELLNNINQIEQQVADNQEVLNQLEEEADNLQSQLNAISIEIDQVNRQIELNELKIEEVKLELEKTQAELARQQDVLATSISALYKRGRISTLEMLASSDNFSDFLSRQEYLENLKEGIQDSVDEVKRLEDQLEAEKKKQEDLLEQKEANRKALQNREDAQQDLLAQTQGEQSRYEAIVSDLENQRQEAQKALNDFLAAQSFVSLGRVSAGQTIGLVGSTGFSTGPHLHLEFRNSSGTVNPHAGGQSMAYGFGWPLPNSSAASITQSYGCVAPYSWYITKCGNMSFHTGLDISGWYGDPIVAPADGDIIFRGWLGGYGNMVLIQHDNGIITAYGHLLE